MPRKRSDSFSLDDAYIDINGSTKAPTENQFFKAHVNSVLEKSIIQPGFTSLEKVPGCNASYKDRKNKIKEEKVRCKGPDWFNMKRPDITTEVENDLKVLQMRSVINPKHFYKKNDIKGLPKYFQVGKYIDSPADFYSSRVPKKERKKTIVEELMADAEFVKYNKRKYKERIKEFKRTHLKAHKHSKKLKNKKR